MAQKQKHVVVLAHADGWGARSANRVVQHLHEDHPDIGIILIVSQATKNTEGQILTKLDDLKLPRSLRETRLLEYFKAIDKLYAEKKGRRPSSRGHYTFERLGRKFCADGQVHYTMRGGPKGGLEVLEIFNQLKDTHGITPEVVLSVDTMAILPAEITDNIPCFSTHPGPLDTIRIEGMQGTLRSLANQVFFDDDGHPLPRDHIFGMGLAHVKGTLFIQHRTLDTGPPVSTVLSPAIPGMCAYQIRDTLYYVLVEEMIKKLPEILNPLKRASLIQHAVAAKAALDAQPHEKVGDLEADQLTAWQAGAVGYTDDAAPHGITALLNRLVDPRYFRNQMRGFFPAGLRDFDAVYDSLFEETERALERQVGARTTNPWARLYSGQPVEITMFDGDGRILGVYGNPGPEA